MVTSRNNRFSKGCNCRSLLVVAAILCGAYAAQAALPSGYTELQYFSMSGNGAANDSTTPLKFWLDTGISISRDSTLEIAFAYDKLANASYQSCLFWSKADDASSFWAYTPSRSNHALANVSDNYYELPYVLEEGSRHVFKLSAGVIYVDADDEGIVIDSLTFIIEKEFPTASSARTTPWSGDSSRMPALAAPSRRAPPRPTNRREWRSCRS